MTVFIALGSNLKPRAQHLQSALLRLKNVDGLAINKISSLYENPAMTPPRAPADWNQPFLNAVVKVEYNGSAEQLLAELQRIEKQLGRQESARWAPRVIDLDILLFGDQKISSPNLTIPHPGLENRNFFLAPLKEVAPTLQLANFATTHPSVLPPSRRVSPWLTQFMHILNLTPDSFSDGGQKIDPKHWSEDLQRLQKSHVAWIDVGAESTAPKAPLVPADDEWSRLKPFFEFYKTHDADNLFRPRLSVDTYKATVAAKALEMGASMINDVSGCSDPEMLSVLQSSSCEYTLMHSLSVPADPQKTMPDDMDVIVALKDWCTDKLELLEKNGIVKERVYFDPGIGFGKTRYQSLEILRRAEELLDLPVRIFVGASRKSFMNLFTTHQADQRDPESLAITLHLAQKGIDLIRVHQADIHARSYLSWLHLQPNVASPFKL